MLIRKNIDEYSQPTKKATKSKKSIWPKVTVGSHSTRTEYEDGSVDFVTDWDALARDVKAALDSSDNTKTVKTKSKKSSKDTKQS